MCIRGLGFGFVYTIYRLDFGIVSIVWYILFFILFSNDSIFLDLYDANVAVIYIITIHSA